MMKRALPFVPITCSVCGEEVEQYAIIGVTEFLCTVRDDSCFSWFSGYPWVLFEMGILTTENLMFFQGISEWEPRNI